MEKLIKKFDINHTFRWRDGEYSIDRIKKDISTAEEMGATHIKVICEDYYGDGKYEAYIKPLIEREETDIEYTARLRYEKGLEEQLKFRELKELSRLMTKYSSEIKTLGARAIKNPELLTINKNL